MRRKDRELTVDEARALIMRAKYGTLCLAAGEDGFPYAVPINCTYYDGKLYFHGAPVGTKLDIIMKDQRASFVAVLSHELVEEKLTAKYESVICSGRIALVEGDAERIEALTVFTAGVFDKPVESVREMVASCGAKTTVMIMDVEKITGKRNQ